MNKNNGYYGWIHSMKQAAVQAQQKGSAMRQINESDDLPVSPRGDSYPVSSRPQFSGQARTPKAGGVENSKRKIMTLDDFKEIHGKLAAEGDPFDGTPEEMYGAYLQGLKRAQDQEMRPKRYIRGEKDMAPVKVDLNKDNDVDGEDQGARAIEADLILRGKKFEAAIDPAYYERGVGGTEPKPLPSFDWAHAEEEGPEAPEDDMDVLPHEEKPAPAGGAWSVRQSFRESVNDKIKRYLR